MFEMANMLQLLCQQKGNTISVFWKKNASLFIIFEKVLSAKSMSCGATPQKLDGSLN